VPIRFSRHPGAFERHLQRRYRNPLFPSASREVDEQQLAEARARDDAERARFQERLSGLLQELSALRLAEAAAPELERLRGCLEQLHNLGAGLGGELGPVCDGLGKLEALLTGALRARDGRAPAARAAIEQAERLRAVRLRLLRHPLVAHIAHPASPIGPEELVSTLLSEDDEEVYAALPFFAGGALRELVLSARALLAGCRADGHELPRAWFWLRVIEDYARRAGVQV